MCPTYALQPPPPPSQLHFGHPATEHMSLHSKSLYKNMARASVDEINMRPLSPRGGTNGKVPHVNFSTLCRN